MVTKKVAHKTPNKTYSKPGHQDIARTTPNKTKKEPTKSHTKLPSMSLAKGKNQVEKKEGDIDVGKDESGMGEGVFSTGEGDIDVGKDESGMGEGVFSTGEGDIDKDIILKGEGDNDKGNSCPLPFAFGGKGHF
ncbi:hypothetical protein BY996DRAFT_6477786 [Phakopsora pachyrhizi]|nr:hypothetical protein BY996DRAFT_6477786 [Phakopsora pachyrhizi]